MEVKLVSHTPNPVEVIEKAASTCYRSKPTDGKIIRHCYLSGHHSILEHASFTFEITGVSRALMSQLTRHRLASFSVQSQRYCSMSKNNYIVPDSISNNVEAAGPYFRALGACMGAYEALTGLGIPKEDARYILPNACSTIITMTMNLRELVHLCHERLCTCAQWEIRRMVKLMAGEVNAATDNAFSYMLVPKCEANPDFPFCTETKARSCKKHPILKEVYQEEPHE